MVDEVDTMFCQDKKWVMTPPMCRGQGLCAADNGGCSHTCISYNDEKIECKCPRGMTLDVDEKTCISELIFLFVLDHLKISRACPQISVSFTLWMYL